MARRTRHMYNLNILVSHVGLILLATAFVASGLNPDQRERNVYVFLIGAGESAKAEFVKHLAGSILAAPGNTSSRITQYTFQTRIEHLGLESAALNIIDVPEFSGSGYACEDAGILTALELFLSKQSELLSKRPSAVLVFLPSSNRVRWSYLLKLIQSVPVFKDRICSPDLANVVFVEKEGKCAGAQRSTVSGAAALSMDVSCDIRHEVFGKLYSSLANDPVASAVTRKVYSGADAYDFRAAYIDISDGCSYFRKLQGILEPVVEDEPEPKTMTEVEEAIARVYENLPAEAQADNKRELEDLLTDLRNLGITNMSDVPKSRADLIKFYTEISVSSFTEDLLLGSLDVAAPSWSQDTLVVGNGYNVLMDRILPSSPFNFQEDRATATGFGLPSSINARFHSEVVNAFQTFPTQSAYFQSKLKELSLENSDVQSKLNCSEDPLSGINILSDPTRNLIGIQERRKFKLALSTSPPTNQEFTDHVQKLPKYNPSDLATVYAWNEFFDQWGTHVVTSVFGGGAIEVRLRKEYRADFESAFTEIFESLVNGANKSSTEANFQYYLHGGSSNPKPARSLAVIGKWEESLMEFPVILKNELGFESIITAVEKVSKFHGKEARRALGAYLGDLPAPALEQTSPERLALNLRSQHENLTQEIQLQQDLLMKLAEEIKNSSLQNLSAAKIFARNFENQRQVKANHSTVCLQRFQIQRTETNGHNLNLRDLLLRQYEESKMRSNETLSGIEVGFADILLLLENQRNISLNIKSEVDHAKGHYNRSNSRYLSIIDSSRNSDLWMVEALKRALGVERAAHKSKIAVLMKTLLRERELSENLRTLSWTGITETLMNYSAETGKHKYMIEQNHIMNNEAVAHASAISKFISQLYSEQRQLHALELERMREFFQKQIELKSRLILQLTLPAGNYGTY